MGLYGLNGLYDAVPPSFPASPPNFHLAKETTRPARQGTGSSLLPVDSGCRQVRSTFSRSFPFRLWSFVFLPVNGLPASFPRRLVPSCLVHPS